MRRCAIIATLLALFVAGTGLWDSGAQEPEYTAWKKRNSVKDETTFKADWAVNGRGQCRFESGGLHLIDDTGITSRFELADQGWISFIFAAANRNLTLEMCGETVNVEAIKGADTYLLDVRRQGRQLQYALTVKDNTTRNIGLGKGKGKVMLPAQEIKTVAKNAILLKEDQAKAPTRITFSSRKVRGPFFTDNSYKDLVLKQILVNGNVKLSPGEPPRQEEKRGKKSKR